MSDIFKDSHGRIWALGRAATATEAKALGMPLPDSWTAVALRKGDLKQFVVEMLAEKFCEDEKDWDD